MKIITLPQIKELLKSIDVIAAIEQGFMLYSTGKTVMAPVSELTFKEPPGDVHIKSGYIMDDLYYVIKVASGFYHNPLLNLPSSNGLLLLFNKKTGVLEAILLDEGYLTDLRTAAAGAIAAKYLAPKAVHTIGIVGTGTQARLQLQFLYNTISCREVLVWGRTLANVKKFQADMKDSGYQITITDNLDHLTSCCNLIVTTTPSSKPLLTAHALKKGTHITAVGADSPGKQELEAHIFKKADLIATDSIIQSTERGEIAHAVHDNIINPSRLLELGNIIAGKNPGRSHDEQITVADLTGLAVQDIQMAKAVYERGCE